VPILVNCSECSRQLRVPDELLGKKVKCPSCGVIFFAEAPGKSAPPPPPPDEEEEERPPSRGRDLVPSRREDEDDNPFEEVDDRPLGRSRRQAPDVRRRSGYVAKPGKVQAIAIMTLIGGILATINAVIIILYFGVMAVASMGLGLVCCLWPGPYYGLVVGILGIIKGSQLLGQAAHEQKQPRGMAILQIVNIINFDVPNLVMGILTLVFCGDPEVQDYFAPPDQ
jgi:hypothetical protein